MTDNPRVNRCLNDEALDHIDHALGRPAWPLRESHRNYFATEAGGEQAREFEASPHWKYRNTAGTMTWYSVTKLGRRVLADHLAGLRLYRVFVVTFDGHDMTMTAATPSKARYSCYLDVRDVYPDLSFLDFMRRSRIRRVVR